MIDTIREIGDSLRRSKLRTALTGLSVSVGIFLLILLLGAGNGIIHAFEAMSGNMTLDVVNLYGGWTTKPYKGFQEGRWIRLDHRDRQVIHEQFSTRVNEETPRLYVGSSRYLNYADKQCMVDMVGVYPDDYVVSGRQMAEGRFINDLDIKQNRKVLVISEQQRDALFPKKGMSALGKYVRFDGVNYQIVGVYRNRGMEYNRDGHIPFTVARNIYNKGTDIGYLRFRTQNVYTSEERERLKNDVRASFSHLHDFAPDDPSGIWMYNSSDRSEEMHEVFNVLRMSMWILGLLTLLSGVVGVSNIMLITVRERTHEFGIRKALGARPYDILKNIVLESVIITAFFGYIGLLFGIAATEYLNYRSGQETIEVGSGIAVTVFQNPTVDLSIAFQALLVLIIAGVLAGVVPARRAVRVKPIEALRSE